MACIPRWLYLATDGLPTRSSTAVHPCTPYFTENEAPLDLGLAGPGACVDRECMDELQLDSRSSWGYAGRTAEPSEIDCGINPCSSS